MQMIDEDYIPSEFDILLTDVHSKDLHHDIAKQLNHLYLSNCDYDDAVTHIDGIIWGPHNRIFVPMIVRIGDVKKHVHFLLDTGSPKTYISQEVFTSFNKMISNPNNPVSLNINNHRIMVFQSPEKSHYEDINILGTDFLKTYNAKLTIDFEHDKVQIVMNVF